MLHTQPVFSSYWVTLPPEPAHDEKMAYTLPPIITLLLHEVKNGDNLGQFLQNKDKRDALKKEVVKLVTQFEQKFRTLWKNDQTTLRKLQNQLQELIKKFDYSGSNSDTNNMYIASYRESPTLFFKILHIIEQEPKSFSEDFLKTTMLSLFDGMGLCFQGVHTRAAYAFMQLSAPTPEHQLLNIRQAMAKKMVLLKLGQHPMMREQTMAGMEIHFLNTILNYFVESFGLKKIDDVYAYDLSKDNPFPPSQNSHHWFLNLKQIAFGIELGLLLTPKAVFEQLAENIAGEICTFKNDPNDSDERDKKIKALLDPYGSDDDFQIVNIIDMKTGKLISKWELLQIIRLTLLKRCPTRLTPTVTLHQSSDPSFNYVTETPSFGSPPRMIPLSNYLLKAAAGYPVSLIQQDNEKELQSDLDQNLITPPALIKCGDVVQIY